MNDSILFQVEGKFFKFRGIAVVSPVDSVPLFDPTRAEKVQPQIQFYDSWPGALTVQQGREIESIVSVTHRRPQYFFTAESVA